MDIYTISCVCFSPTGSTKRLTELVAGGTGAKNVNVIDITLHSHRPRHPLTFHKEVVVLAAPVYFGRIPEEAMSSFSTLIGNQTPAVLIVVYGNRAFEDALIELRDIAVERSFVPVAGGAFLAEHSYSSSSCPIAPGRPDESDLQKALAFGAAIKDKLLRVKSLDNVATLSVPGHYPYIEPKNWILMKNIRATTSASITPETDMNECTRCGLCAEVCPTGAVTPDDVTKTDKMKCIICFACVKRCPEVARQMKDPQFIAAIQGISKTCQERREPEVYL